MNVLVPMYYRYFALCIVSLATNALVIVRCVPNDLRDLPAWPRLAL